MTPRTFAGGWYADCLPDGSFAVLFEGSHIETHLGRVELPTVSLDIEREDNVLYLRIWSGDVFKIAGQSHRGQGNVEWRSDTRAWRIVGPSYGVNPVLYDRQGNLHTGAPHFGSQGLRHLDDSGMIVTGDQTYADPALKLWEYTKQGDIWIGQGENYGAEGIRESDHVVRRLILEGHGPKGTTFIRFTRDGDSCALAAWQQGVGAQLLWFNASEWASFPAVTQPEPKPKPEPEPEPKPRPEPMEAPNRFRHVQELATHYPALVTNFHEGWGQFIQHALLMLNFVDPGEWGHVAKTAGEGQYTPPGFEPRDVNGHRITGFSQDAIFHKPSHTQIDILSGGQFDKNGDPNPNIDPNRVPQWDVIPREHYRPNNPWMAPVPISGAEPDPNPKPGPVPQPGPVDPLYAALKPALATLTTAMKQLQSVPGPTSTEVVKEVIKEVIVEKDRSHPSYDEVQAMAGAVNAAYREAQKVKPKRDLSPSEIAHLAWRYTFEDYTVDQLVQEARERAAG
jgi:hypothetical protein